LLNESGQPEDRPVRRLEFLKDVFICSLGAYGGPETHISVLMDHLVVRRGYLSRHDLIELVALCSILPGPTSTQTIVSIGHRLGGPWLGLWAMLVWAVPALMAMTALSFLYRFWAAREVSMDALRYVGPIAIGFILVAAVRIGRTVVTDRPTALLMLLGAAATYVVRSPWIFPLVLLAGGACSMLHYREPGMWNRVRLRPPWRYLALFVGLAVGLIAAAQFAPYRLVTLFECFYRYGYLVFGGGQVIVPVMHSELVEVRQYLTNPEFLTGYGLVQGLPGPMFSFAAYAGGMAARGGSVGRQLLGALAGGVGIFLPGLLLIYFVYPVWERLKQIRAIRISLRGINAVAGGLIAIAAVILLQAIELRPDTLAVMALSVIFLASRRIPAPVIVAAGLLAGWLF
jgi:chromate transporter